MAPSLALSSELLSLSLSLSSALNRLTTKRASAEPARKANQGKARQQQMMTLNICHCRPSQTFSLCFGSLWSRHATKLVCFPLDPIGFRAESHWICIGFALDPIESHWRPLAPIRSYSILLAVAATSGCRLLHCLPSSTI